MSKILGLLTTSAGRIRLPNEKKWMDRMFWNAVCDAASTGWMQSESAAVALGIWDKNQSHPNGFDTNFIVKTPSGSTCEKVIHFSGNENWEFVQFPSDFVAAGKNDPNCSVPSNGKYAWSAQVDGQVVAQGRFVFKRNRAELILQR